jgi:hypothetical protein
MTALTGPARSGSATIAELELPGLRGRAFDRRPAKRPGRSDLHSQKGSASNIYATHGLTAGDITQWSTPTAVKPSRQEQFFPWMSSAPNGRVDLVFYDRSCDPAGDKLNCVTVASTADDGSSWGFTTLLSTPFDGDLHHAVRPRMIQRRVAATSSATT